MANKLNKEIIKNVTKLINKFGVNDTLSFDNPYRSTVDKSRVNGYITTDNNMGTFYDITKNATFIICDDLESAYNLGTDTMYIVLLDEWWFISRDCKTWGSSLGEIYIDKELSEKTQLEISIKNHYTFVEKINKITPDNDIKKIDMSEWNKIVSDTYGKIYNLQQQGAYRAIYRGSKTKNLSLRFSVPCNETYDIHMDDCDTKNFHSGKQGVKFSTWLDRNPGEHNFKNDNYNTVFWCKRFYPDIYTLANDLYEKGVIEQGNYVIDIIEPNTNDMWCW